MHFSGNTTKIVWSHFHKSGVFHSLKFQFNKPLTNVDVLLTVLRSANLVNDQLDAQFFYFIIRLLQSSTCFERPPLWSSGQSFWLQIQRSRVRFPALPDFLSSRGSGTGSTQPREVNWGATWIKSSGSGPENRWTAVGIRCADHVTPLYPQKLALTSPIGGGRSVGIVRSRTKATEFS